MAFPINREAERLFVAGVGFGISLGRTADGFYLMDFPHVDHVVACLPGTVFELGEGDHRPVCAFSREWGTS